MFKANVGFHVNGRRETDEGGGERKGWKDKKRERGIICVIWCFGGKWATGDKRNQIKIGGNTQPDDKSFVD